jgi:hypothetical protein
MFAACFLGLVAVVHGFTQSDAGNIGRYVFGFLMAFAVVVLLEVGTHFRESFRARLAGVAALVGVAAETVEDRWPFVNAANRGFKNIDALAMKAPGGLPRAEREVHVHAQSVVPAGARMAVLVDEPYHLDYARNTIFNLDMPGFARLPPSMPYFQGPAAVADYFRGLDVRYLVFVRGEFSTYMYRRNYWVERLMDDAEIWRNSGPYVIDLVDNLAALATTHRVAFEDRGVVVLDLGEVRR